MDTGMLVQVYVGDSGYQNCLLLMGGLNPLLRVKWRMEPHRQS